MDFPVIILILFIFTIIAAHPATADFINYLKYKKPPKRYNAEEHSCYHTAEDCANCLISNTCSRKHENLVIPRKSIRDEERDNTIE